MENTKPRLFRLHWLFWVGLGALCIGSGPLLVVIPLASLGLTADPNPNPIGLGIMAALSFWPSMAAMLVGLALSISRHRKALKPPDADRTD